MARKFLAGALSAVTLAVASLSSQAATIQLGFILDESGSIGSGNWNIIRQGLSDAIDLIPVGGANTYEVSIVTFGNTTNTRASNVLINSVAARDALSNAVAAYAFGNGSSTNYTLAFQAMDTVLRNTASAAAATYVNFATDGAPNPSGSDGVAVRNSMISTAANGYVDNISIEAIGSIGSGGVSLLQNQICYPQPCDTTNPYNFPTQGFYIAVADASAYAAAIQNKVRVVTGQIPEPHSLALVGLALVGAGLARRKMARA